MKNIQKLITFIAGAIYLVYFDVSDQTLVWAVWN